MALDALASPTAADGLVCRIDADLPLASLSAAAGRDTKTLYRINQRAGAISLTLDHCGLFAARGSLARYAATLVVDPTAPLATRVDLAFDTASVALVADSNGDLPFNPRFDAAAHPVIRFRSTAVSPASEHRYQVRGLLDIAGVTRLQTAFVAFANHHVDPISGTAGVDLLVELALSAASFGLMPGQTFLCDRIELRCRGRIELDN